MLRHSVELLPSCLSVGSFLAIHVVKTGNMGRAATVAKQIEVTQKHVALKVCGALCSPLVLFIYERHIKGSFVLCFVTFTPTIENFKKLEFFFQHPQHRLNQDFTK